MAINPSPPKFAQIDYRLLFREDGFHDIPLDNDPIPEIHTQSTKSQISQLNFHSVSSVSILLFCNLLNYMDRYTIAGVLTSVQSEFDVNSNMMGLLQTVFIVSFMIFAPLFGYYGDRLSRKWICVGGLAVWSSAILVSSFIPKSAFWALLLMRGIVGIGEASFCVVSPTIIADLFAGSVRSRIIMIYYFAIPVGSGFGFIIGSKIAQITGSWRHSLQLTPALGLFCLIALIFVIKEPQRGKIEKEMGAHKATDYTESRLKDDLKYLFYNKTYVFATIGFTATVFVTGTFSWWGNTAVEYAHADQLNYNDTSQLIAEAGDNSALIFGGIMVMAGLVGVTIGTTTSQLWQKGKLCCSANMRADPFISLIGCFGAAPFILLGFYFIYVSWALSWFFIFIAMTFLCLNWAVIVDMQLSIVLPRRRSIANALQILVSHMFGDAPGPWLIGLISDLIRGNEKTPKSQYHSLLIAFYIPIAILFVGVVGFGFATYFIAEDREKFDKAMGYKSNRAVIMSKTSRGDAVVAIQEP